MGELQSIDINNVTLTGSSITEINYIDGSFDITEGEASSPPPQITQSGSEWTIGIQANRQNSSLVATKFNSVTGGAGHVYPTWAMTDRSPDQLNFYFGINVTAGADTVSLYLGQGHTGLDNNWWIGGSALAVQSIDVAAQLTIGGSTVPLVVGGMSAFVIEF
jgi:hypothetical protein